MNSDDVIYFNLSDYTSTSSSTESSCNELLSPGRIDIDDESIVLFVPIEYKQNTQKNEDLIESSKTLTSSTTHDVDINKKKKSVLIHKYGLIDNHSACSYAPSNSMSFSNLNTRPTGVTRIANVASRSGLSTHSSFSNDECTIVNVEQRPDCDVNLKPRDITEKSWNKRCIDYKKWRIFRKCYGRHDHGKITQHGKRYSCGMDTDSLSCGTLLYAIVSVIFVIFWFYLLLFWYNALDHQMVVGFVYDVASLDGVQSVRDHEIDKPINSEFYDRKDHNNDNSSIDTLIEENRDDKDKEAAKFEKDSKDSPNENVIMSKSFFTTLKSYDTEEERNKHKMSITILSSGVLLEYDVLEWLGYDRNSDSFVSDSFKCCPFKQSTARCISGYDVINNDDINVDRQRGNSNGGDKCDMIKDKTTGNWKLIVYKACINHKILCEPLDFAHVTQEVNSNHKWFVVSETLERLESNTKTYLNSHMDSKRPVNGKDEYKRHIISSDKHIEHVYLSKDGVLTHTLGGHAIPANDEAKAKPPMELEDQMSEYSKYLLNKLGDVN